MTSPTERKRAQRDRDRREGIALVPVRVPKDRAQEVRDLAAQLLDEYLATTPARPSVPPATKPGT